MTAIVPARVYLHNGALLRLGQFTTASAINRAHTQQTPQTIDQASVTVATTDPLLAEIDPAEDHLLVIESDAYPVPWVGLVTRPSKNARAARVTFEAKDASVLLQDRVIPPGADLEGEAVSLFAALLAAVNRRNPTGIELGLQQSTATPVALTVPDATAFRALNALTEQAGLEWWMDYDVQPQTIRLRANIAPARGDDLYDSHLLLEGPTCEPLEWLEDREARLFALTIVGGQTSVTQAYGDRARATQIRQEGGDFLAPLRDSISAQGQTADGLGTGAPVVALEDAPPTINRFRPERRGAVTSSLSRREALAVSDPLRDSSRVKDAARHRLQRPRAERRLRLRISWDPSGPADQWHPFRPGNWLRFSGLDLFGRRLDQPIRLVGVQPMEELGEIDLACEIWERV